MATFFRQEDGDERNFALQSKRVSFINCIAEGPASRSLSSLTKKGINMKLAYERPLIRSHGSVESITKGGSAGDFLDASFPSNTPRGDLTFS